MYNYERYTGKLDGDSSSLDLFFYFKGDRLLRVSFGKDKDFATAVHRARPKFLKGFERFLQGKKPFDNSIISMDDLQGTPFQKAVWKQLLRIPRGKTISYGEIAEKLQRPHAYRAVGSAVGKNPLAVIIPCHRVLHAGRKKVGKFGGGEALKKALLENEGISLAE